MAERRQYTRMNVTLNGTVFTKGYDIPVLINNFSIPTDTDNFTEIGIGFQCKDKDMPTDDVFAVDDMIELQFLDDDFVSDLVRNVQIFKAQIVQVTDQMRGKLVGVKLVGNSLIYSLYVCAKKKAIIEKEAEQLENFLDSIDNKEES